MIHIFLKVNLVLGIMISSVTLCFGQQHNTVMLVLGSDDLTTLRSRTMTASHLEKSKKFDKIIVSGGCGAHNSSICEASLMTDILVEQGVNRAKIYLDENSKTTVQNYVYSRALRDENGNKIIQSKDTLYVVSNHWHAISVAARFERYDDVVAFYHIEGNIKPKSTDKTDYVNILNGEEDNALFTLKGSWPTPNAVWKEGEKINYLFGEMVYETDLNNDSFVIKDRKEVFPNVNTSIGSSLVFIDKGKNWLIKSNDSFFLVDKKSKKILNQIAEKDLFKSLPNQKALKDISSGIEIDNKLWLFGQNRVVLFDKIRDKYIFQKKGDGTLFLSEWPFAWGKSNVSAIFKDEKSDEIYMYRNMEFLKINSKREMLQLPKKLPLKWIK